METSKNSVGVYCKVTDLINERVHQFDTKKCSTNETIKEVNKATY